MVYGVNDLLTDISNVYATGGTEYGMTAMLNGISLINNIDYKLAIDKGNHNFIVLTDEDADDPHLTASVIDAATEVGKASIRIHFFFGGIYQHDNYDLVRVATNGIAVEQINPTGLTVFTDYILSELNFNQPTTPPNTRRKRTSCETFTITYFMSSFQVLVTSTAYGIPSFIFTKPDGTVTYVEAFGNFAVYKTSEPQVGQWQICDYYGSVSVKLSTTSFLDFSVAYLATTDDNILLPTNDIQYICKYAYTNTKYE